MNDPAIIATDIHVAFRPFADRVPTARRSIGKLRHRETREVVALDGASCRIDRGEAIAIVGRNGAGKSTLLRVLAGTLEPDSGTVEVFGEPPTLLQLGVGFNGKLSGKHNVFLGGLALGHTRAEMEAMLPQIEAFAEIGEAIDRPVNTYSSGMRSRLAFAIAMTLKPETLLLDEILAVGDASFKERSMAALQDLVDHAGTVVMVTHSLSQAKRFCDTAIWLDAGRVKMVGPADEVISEYSSASEEAIGATDKPPGEWNAKERTQLIRRLLAGSKAVDLAAESGVDVAEIVTWRRRFIEGGRRALRPRFDGDDDDE